MEVIQVSDRPAPLAFTVAGRLLFIESPARDLIELLFAGWQLTPVTSTDSDPDIKIIFSCGEKAPEIPSGLNQFEIADGGQCYTSSEGLYLELGSALVQLVEARPVTVNVWLKELPGPADPLLATVASFAVCAALRRYGVFDLHSAGVVSPENGKGVLIVGRSGSGKSTLALQLAMSGWPYLSDDELLLSLVDTEVEARGFRSFFAVSTGEEKAHLKRCFEPDAALGLKRVAEASPGLALFVSLNGESKSELRSLTQAGCMMRLIRACPWASYDTRVAGANLEVLSALARQVTAFDLSAGRDLLQPGRAAELLSGL